MRKLILRVEDDVQEMYDNYMKIYKEYMIVLGNEDKLEELIITSNSAIVQEGIKSCTVGIVETTIEAVTDQLKKLGED